MRDLAKLSLYIAVVVLVGGLLAYPLYRLILRLAATGLVEAAADVPFRRVADRSFMCVALLGLYPLVRSFRLRTREEWGFGTGAERLGLAGIGLAGGVGLAMLAVVLECVLHIRLWDHTSRAEALLLAFLEGALSGVAIGVIEETFFRGALFTVLRRDVGVRCAVLATSCLYASCHFLRTDDRALASVTWHSGFAVLRGSFAAFGTWSFVGPFLALLTLGILLALIRVCAGHNVVNIGLHAGLVLGIRVAHEATDSNPASRLSWLASGYDGVTGYLVFALLASALLAVAVFGRHRNGRRVHVMAV